MKQDPTASAADLLSNLSSSKTIFDVRSPKEYHKGHVPFAINIPILDDQQRHQIGISFKQEGEAAATMLGHQLVNATDFVERCRAKLKSQKPDYIYCARGGKRSSIAQSWLSDSGLAVTRISGGYKHFRRSVLAELDRNYQILVLAGMTGSGKTAILEALKSQPQTSSSIIDLESIANHRGSAFGHQSSAVATQQNFENQLAHHLNRAEQPILLEDESRFIGSCRLPLSLFEQMKTATSIMVEEQIHVRSARIFQEYVIDDLGPAPTKSDRADLYKKMSANLQAISKKLGGLNLKSIQKDLNAAFSDELDSFERHRQWIEKLLSLYYDDQYEHSMGSKMDLAAYRGSNSECFEYLQTILSRPSR